MVAILFLIGQKLEKPEIIDEMLNNINFKPIYNMAPDLGLTLYDCIFEDIDWIFSNDLKFYQKIKKENNYLKIQSLLYEILFKKISIKNNDLKRENEINYKNYKKIKLK
jgi:tRNA pseudouridine38/39 synthase